MELLERLRELCLAQPEAHEVEAWGEPTFRVRNKIFAMYAGPNNHHGSGQTNVWLKAAAGAQEVLVSSDPERFFVPPYVGPKGWVGVHLDDLDQWAVVEDLVSEAYRLIAPKRLLALYSR